MKLFLVVVFCLATLFATGNATDAKKIKEDVMDQIDEAVSKGAITVSEASPKKGAAPVGSTLLGSATVWALAGRA